MNQVSRSLLQDNLGVAAAYIVAVGFLVIAIAIAWYHSTKAFYVVEKGEVAISEQRHTFFFLAKDEHRIIVGPERLIASEDHEVFVIPRENVRIPFSVRVVPGTVSGIVDKMETVPIANQVSGLAKKLVTVTPYVIAGELIVREMPENAIARLFKLAGCSNLALPLIEDIRNALEDNLHLKKLEEFEAAATDTLAPELNNKFGLQVENVTVNKRRAITPREEVNERIESAAILPTTPADKSLEFYWEVFLLALPLAILAMMLAIALLYACPDLILVLPFFDV